MKFRIGVTTALTILGIINLGYFVTKAQVAGFYPATCQGTWQNPQNAKGLPENLSRKRRSADSAFTASNSAVFAVSSTQIYCGGFLPQGYIAKGNIKNVGLTLVWQIDSPARLSPSTATPANASTSRGIPAPPVPIAADENFLKVSYGTDGKIWTEIVKVNLKNWRNLDMTLPLKNWDDLKRLQVKIEDIPTALSQIPKVYLDGMLLQSYYELPLVPAVNVISKKEEPKPAKIFDPNSKHTCSVEPFMQKARAGEIVKYQIKLTPSYENAPFELKIGGLPRGISALFDQRVGRGVAQSFMSISIPGGARKGSFNIVAIYEERGRNNVAIPNFCQLNLIVE